MDAKTAVDQLLREHADAINEVTRCNKKLGVSEKRIKELEDELHCMKDRMTQLVIFVEELKMQNKALQEEVDGKTDIIRGLRAALRDEIEHEGVGVTLPSPTIPSSGSDCIM